jgi:RNA polymerase sigma-70 factor (ECF subfamily)
VTDWSAGPSVQPSAANFEYDSADGFRMSVFRLHRFRGQEPRHEAPTDAVDALTALLQRAGRGDEAAFGELYDELAGLINGTVRRVVRDPSQSDEVTQEVFIELWRLAPRFDEARGSVRSWAVTIAHRRAIDRVRSEQASRDRLERESNKRVIEHDAVADEVETTFEQARVRRALGRLTAPQREAVELAYFGGHTYREVATLLDVAEGTVKSRIRDGMIRLRDELGASA